MKIYTKKGDLGKTSLIGESNVDKHHHRIEAYGTIDELNSYLGLVRSYDHSKFKKNKQQLVFIQNCLFKIGASLAKVGGKKAKPYNAISLSDVESIEKFIDEIQNSLDTLQSFILPGGNVWSSYVQISRSICRRAERRITLLNQNHVVDLNIIKFINRLSDYLFVLARHINSINDINEIKWNN